MNFLKRNFFKKFLFFTFVGLIVNLYLTSSTQYFLELSFNDSCPCNKDFKIDIKKTDDRKYIIELENKFFVLNSEPVLTCDLHKTLKRGPNQKVITFSLYGKNPRYYKLLKELIVKVKELYPDYVMRIYHDDSVKRSLICQNECSNSHVDFCNVHKIPLSLTESNKVLDLKNVHAMMWRFLPVGDNFVSHFMSRDMDSELLQREVDSVQMWLKSKNIGHIMRDHPLHIYYILGGMWGLKVNKARKLGKEIYEKIININTTAKYNPELMHKRGFDQDFLADNVYSILRPISTIHDSFMCKKFSDSTPWPTRRLGNCFVGIIGKCDPNSKFKICPNECRPIDNLDWENC